MEDFFGYIIQLKKIAKEIFTSITTCIELIIPKVPYEVKAVIKKIANWETFLEVAQNYRINTHTGVNIHQRIKVVEIIE